MDREKKHVTHMVFQWPSFLFQAFTNQQEESSKIDTKYSRGIDMLAYELPRLHGNTFPELAPLFAFLLFWGPFVFHSPGNKDICLLGS